jgi:cell division protein FtsN
MIFGLAIGLAVAAAIYVAGPRTETVKVAGPPPALDKNSDVPEPVKKPAQAAAQTEEPARFVFYELLKKMEIEVESGDVEVAKDVAPRAVVAEGTYILQAGSFSRREDAERRRAELGLQGIESRVVAADVNNQRFFRVYIGPISDLDRLNLVRSQLRAAKIDVLRITVDQ